MDYISVNEARGLKGLRLVLSAGVPGPWGIAAKALFKARGVPFIAVRQEIMQPNEDLVAWTGRRNAPIAVYDEEPGLDNWLDIVMLAERLGSGPSLLPADPVDEALCLGFSAQICGHGGYAWSRRLMMRREGTPSPQSDDIMAKRAAMMNSYGAPTRPKKRRSARSRSFTAWSSSSTTSASAARTIWSGTTSAPATSTGRRFHRWRSR